MEKKDIVTRAANMHTKSDLLLLLNALLKDEMGGSCKFEFSIEQLEFNSNPKNDKRYRHFSIPKKSGGERIISAPSRGLRHILQYVNIFFKSLYTPSEYAMGYCVGRNVVDNAVLHLGQNYIFNTDLEDLFPSIHQFRVQRRLKAAPFNFSDSISRVLAGLCCLRKEKDNGCGYEYVLPQGAPTSPILANAVCDDLDRKLAGLSRRFGLHYTRYADDITFSSMHNVYQKDGEFLKEFEKIVKGQGFRVNKEKTRLQKVGQHQEVTGLTVSSRVNTAREYVAEIRNILHIWERYGFEDAYASFYRHYVCCKGHIKKRIPLLENVLFGKLQYLKMVKGEKDPVYSALQARYNNLASPINIDRKKFDYLYSFPREEFEEKIGCRIKYRLSAKGGIYGEFVVEDTPTHVTISQPVKTQLMSSGNPMDLYVVLVSKDGKEPFWMLTYGDPLDGQRLDRKLVSELLEVWQNDGIKVAISKYKETGKQIPSQELENMLLNNRGLSANDKLLVQGLLRSEMKMMMGGEEAKRSKSKRKQEHRPKDTATFLALFNDPEGFKYLTHEFDDEEGKNYERFIKGVRSRFDKETKNNKKIPESLWSLMDVFLNGGPEPWTAYDGTKQREGYGCTHWLEWSQKNPGEHVITNGRFGETINLFRQTTRIAGSACALNDIVVKLAEKHPDLEINPVNLEGADFYTYVYYLIEGIDRIFRDISQLCKNKNRYVGGRPKVNISFKKTADGDEFPLRIISITHCGSKAYNFKDAYKKYKEGGGAFNKIKGFFYGYCNWSVVAEWDGEKTKRWDLLDDTGRAEVETLSEADEAPEGFTHILTYYTKNKNKT